jgi:hypothetical protein
MTHAPPGTTPIVLPPWSWLVVAAALLCSYLVLQENGLLLEQWRTLHEFFHDGRHALGVPCH